MRKIKYNLGGPIQGEPDYGDKKYTPQEKAALLKRYYLEKNDPAKAYIDYNKKPLEWFDIPEHTTNRFNSIDAGNAKGQYLYDSMQNQYLQRNVGGKYRLPDPEMLPILNKSNKFANGGQIFDTIGQLAPLLGLIPGAGQIAAPLVGMGASFLGNKARQGQQGNNGLQPTNYSNSAAFGYADGGDLSQIAQGTYKVNGAPNQTDGNAVNYKGQNINLDYGETLDTNKDRVISDKYFNPETGKKFSDEDTLLKRIRAKSEKQNNHSPDLASRNTPKIVSQMEDDLFQKQEMIAQALGDRADQQAQQPQQQMTKGYEEGGNVQPIDSREQLLQQMAEMVRAMNKPQALDQSTRPELFPEQVNYNGTNSQVTSYPKDKTDYSTGRPVLLPRDYDKSKTKANSSNVELQKKLISLGYDNIGKAGIKGDTDGIIGERTKSALRKAIASGKMDDSYGKYLSLPSKRSTSKTISKQSPVSGQIGSIDPQTGETIITENEFNDDGGNSKGNYSIYGTDGMNDFSNNESANKLFNKVKGGRGYTNDELSNNGNISYSSLGSSPMAMMGMMDQARQMSPKRYKEAAQSAAQDAIMTEVGGGAADKLIGWGLKGLLQGSKIAGYLPEGQKMLNAGQKMLPSGEASLAAKRAAEALAQAEEVAKHLPKERAKYLIQAAQDNYVQTINKAEKVIENMAKSAASTTGRSNANIVNKVSNAKRGLTLKSSFKTAKGYATGGYIDPLNPLAPRSLNSLAQVFPTYDPTLAPRSMRGASVSQIGDNAKIGMPVSNYNISNRPGLGNVAGMVNDINGNNAGSTGGAGNGFFGSMTTGEKVGLGADALSVGLKAIESFQPVQKEQYRYNNAPISLNALDPSYAINNNQGSYNAALNDMNNNSSTGSNRAAQASALFSNRLKADNDVLSKYGEQNSNIANNYEQRLGQRNSENNAMAYQVDDLNSRNRGAAENMRMGVYGDLATMGLNTSNVINNRMTEQATLAALKKMAPDVYQNLMKTMDANLQKRIGG